jgi:hypothetical protein
MYRDNGGVRSDDDRNTFVELLVDLANRFYVGFCTYEREIGGYFICKIILSIDGAN